MSEYNENMGIIDAVFPIRCVGCGRNGKYICDECWRGVGGSSRPFERLNDELSRVYASYQYGGVIQKLLKKIKYKSSWKMVDELADRWVEKVSNEMLGEVSEREIVVMSVPMYHTRQRERGFNQAERLGRKLAERLDVKYFDGLKRVKSTKPMYGLSKEERGGNVRGAFGVKDKVKSELVILVDDVWTTGSTMRECSRVLSQVGVEEVWGVVVAR